MAVIAGPGPVFGSSDDGVIDFYLCVPRRRTIVIYHCFDSNCADHRAVSNGQDGLTRRFARSVQMDNRARVIEGAAFYGGIGGTPDTDSTHVVVVDYRSPGDEELRTTIDIEKCQARY